MRDEFSKDLCAQLAKRVAHVCSNPGCRAVTAGPHSDPGKSTVVGEAAHITAASPKGPRYDVTLTEVERTAATNAIWLCRICARRIDVDADAYPVALLRSWKEAAEEDASTGLGRSTVQSSHQVERDDPARHLGFARMLLSLSTPPSLVARFPEPSPSVSAALARLAAVHRHAIRREDPRGTVELYRLRLEPSRENLVIGPGGGGKTHALWGAAHDQLADPSAPLWLFITASDFETADELLGFVHAHAGREECAKVLDAPDIVICLDGWAEFPRTAGAHDERERRLVLAGFGNCRVIATGRRAREDDARFTVWDLQPLPESALEGIELASGLQDTGMSEGRSIRPLPLVLVLSLLLGGSASSRGVLLDRFHRHQARDLVQGAAVLEAMSLAAADCGSRIPPAHDVFLGFFDRRVKGLGVAESRDSVERLGTLTEHRGKLRPVHDLYWEWLVGRGLLLSGRPLPTTVARRLDLREGLSLALESGIVSTADQVREAATSDVTLAALLATGLSAADEDASNVRITVMDRASELLDDVDPAERYRGAIAALTIGDEDQFERAVISLSKAREELSLFGELVECVSVDRLWQTRARLERALEDGRLQALVLEIVGARGDERWLPWLERLVDEGKLALPEASAAALACSWSMPPWCARQENTIFTRESYRLRAVTERGRNAAAADWLADDLERLVEGGSGSLPFHICDAIVRCAHDSALERMLARLSTMDQPALDAASYVFDKRGEAWVGKAQTILFALSPARGGVFIAQEPGIVAEDTARAWTTSEFESIQSLGWRALVRVRGRAALEDVVTALPTSFGGRDRVPTLGALAEVEGLPESLIQDLFDRLNRPADGATASTIMPGTFEQFVRAVSKIEPGGVLRMIGLLLRQPQLFDGYQLSRFLPIWVEWERRSGLELRADGDNGPPLYTRLLYDRLRNEPTAALLERAVRVLGLRAVSAEIADKAGEGDAVACKIVRMAKMSRFHAGLFARLRGTNDFDEIVSVFGDALATFPSEALRDLTRMAIGTEVRMDRLLSAFAAIGPLVPDDALETIVNDVVAEGMPSSSRRLRIAGLLASHPKALTHRIFRDAKDPVARWLIRASEKARGELLLDDRGAWFSSEPRRSTA